MVGMPVADEYRKLSFWHETVPGTLEPGDPLAGDLDADVAIAAPGTRACGPRTTSRAPIRA
jgi:hypothetical protein